MSSANYLYHGTTKARGIKIQKDGLKSGVQVGNTSAYYIYLADSEQYAQSYAKRKGGISGILLRIPHTSNMIHDPDTGLKGDYKVTDNIRPEQIEIKIKNSWIPISKYDFIEEKIKMVKQVTESELNKIHKEGSAAFMAHLPDGLNKDPQKWGYNPYPTKSEWKGKYDSELSYDDDWLRWRNWSNGWNFEYILYQEAIRDAGKQEIRQAKKAKKKQAKAAKINGTSMQNLR